ncbi:hypothetical protein KM043_009968 [Ampulex compressa]|nr:hypothetical protein KM043_009968 [Ampulex compressa]
MIRKLARNVCGVAWRMINQRSYGTAQAAALQQAALEERCILVDELDRALGEASKRDCHTVDSHGHIPLHRAFSVFLFNSKGDLLLQKRASSKITFPDHYTNTCCSHPLAEIPGETVEKDALGIRRAAQRRLGHELGIPASQDVTLDPNPDEISEIHWVSRNDIDQFVKKLDSPLTPWFELILKEKLPLWWDNLQSLHKMKDHYTIQRFI